MSTIYVEVKPKLVEFATVCTTCVEVKSKHFSFVRVYTSTGVEVKPKHFSLAYCVYYMH